MIHWTALLLGGLPRHVWALWRLGWGLPGSVRAAVRHHWQLWYWCWRYR